MEAFWDDIEKRFSSLHNEQVSEGIRLHASKDDDTWTVDGGTQNAKKRFEWLAERAALRLGVPPGRDPVFSWLDRLKKESPRYEPMKTSRRRRKSELDSEEMSSREYETTQPEVGIIDFLCQASSEYCVRCDSREQTKRDADPRIETAMAKPATSSLTDREKKIWGVIQQGAEGAQYCRELHNAGLRPRSSWIKRGCPGTYQGVCNNRQWLQRAQDEKSKVRRKALQLSPPPN